MKPSASSTRLCRLYLFLLVVALAALWPAFALAQVNNPPPGTPPLDGLSNFALWSLIAGYLGPWIIEVINRERWQPFTKYATFFAYCCLTAGLNAYFNRTLGWDDWIRTLMLIVGTGIVSYMAQKKAINALGQKTG